MEKERKFRKWLYYFTLGVVLIVIYKLFDNFNEIGEAITKFIKILMPFFIGILIAYILYTPAKKIEECFLKSKFKILNKKARALSIFIIYLILTIIIFILINVILPPITDSISDLVGNLPGYYESLRKVINELPEEYEAIKTTANDTINQLSKIDFAEYLSIESVTQYIKGALSVVYGIFDVFVIIIISIYTLSERTKIIQFLKKVASSLFKEHNYGKISKYFKETNKIFFGFISGQAVDAVIIGIVTTIAMSVMNIKYAGLLGTLIGTFNLIPFLGAIVAVVISIIITICTGGIVKALWLAIIIVILQQIDANIINPKILGNKLSISPILVIVSVTVGGAYFSILGMFLAVPVVAILKLILNDYLDYLSAKKSK